MTECLGIYVENNIVKYSKLELDNNRNIILKDHGIRFIKQNVDEVILNIIEETNSKDIPLVFNSKSDIYTNFQIIESNSKKSYTKEILNTEFEAWCEKNAKSPEKFEYTYAISSKGEGTNKCSGILDIVSKNSLNEIVKNDRYKVSGIYPANILVNNIVDSKVKDYILLNISSKIIASVIIDNKIVETKILGNGITKIIEEFKEKLGSYQNVYLACRKINVYSENSSNNDGELEDIAEPILQDIIKNISSFVTKYKMNVNNMYITGDITLFRNIDILLKEYFDLNCDILIPKIVKKDNSDIAEIVEVTPAIVIAYEHINSNNKNNFLVKNNKKTLFQRENTKDKNNKNLNVLEITLGIVTILFITYISFGTIYSNKVNKIVEEANSGINNINSNISKINEDIKYISENKEKYKKINEQVEKVVKNLSDNNINGAYNVATFLQNIIRIIPENVKLNSISSDDNKNIKIVAESDDYANLGYFISEIKLEGTLKNVTITDVKNGDITTVEIGGELP